MKHGTESLDLSADIIDVRDLVARVECLEETADGNAVDDGVTETMLLLDLLEELKGRGGDEQWRGDWYPVTLIRYSHWKDYATDLAEDLNGKELESATWPFNCIDWDKAAAALRMDYTSVEINGVTYYCR